jgi:hypothetical protein
VTTARLEQEALTPVVGNDSVIDITVANNRAFDYAYNMPNGAAPAPEPDAADNTTSGLRYENAVASSPAKAGVTAGTSATRLRLPVNRLPNKLLLYPDPRPMFARSAEAAFLDSLPLLFGNATMDSASSQLSVAAQGADNAQCLNSTPDTVIGRPSVDLVSSAQTGMRTAINCLSKLTQFTIADKRREAITSVLTALSIQSSALAALASCVWWTQRPTQVII